MKEDLVPAQSDKVVFILAPAITVITALIATTVIPWGDTVTLFGRTVPLHIADVNVAVHKPTTRGSSPGGDTSGGIDRCAGASIASTVPSMNAIANSGHTLVLSDIV